MSSRSFRIALWIVLSTVGLMGIAGVYVGYKIWNYPDQPHQGGETQVVVHVRKGMTFPQISQLLVKEGVISNARWFRLYAMHQGVTTQVRSGTYSFDGDQTPKQVLDRITKGVDAVTTDVTIPEGLNMLETIAIIARAGVAKANELEVLARDPKFAGKHNIPGETIEGYLFPNTYQFRVPTPPEKVLSRLIEQHHRVWRDVYKRNMRGAQHLNRLLKWNNRELIILASILEKEAVSSSELPRIAQVFLNRLLSPSFRPKRLETDPTIRYGCMVPLRKSAACKAWDPSKRLRRAQLSDADNLYNTYQHEGLPPGPICSPGKAALEAVLKPDGSKYFFFVSRNDGTHVFSKTLREHRRAVDKYQR